MFKEIFTGELTFKLNSVKSMAFSAYAYIWQIIQASGSKTCLGNHIEGTVMECSKWKASDGKWIWAGRQWGTFWGLLCIITESDFISGRGQWIITKLIMFHP